MLALMLLRSWRHARLLLALAALLLCGPLVLGCSGQPAIAEPTRAATESASASSESSNTPAAKKVSAMKLTYPETRKSDHVDTYHGVQVPDPYRWLEDPDSPETRAWIAAQNKVTESYLSAIPSREPMRKRLTALWNYERYGVPSKQGERYFFSRNTGLQNQAVLYFTPSFDEEPRELLDPNTLSSEGTVALTNWSPSPSGKLLAYGLAAAGSDWQEFKVRDVATAKDTEDHLRWIKFSGISWRRDGSGFYYSRYDEPAEGTKFTGANYYHKLYFHRLGTPQSDDVLVYHRDDEKEWGFHGHATEDGRYLVIQVNRGTARKRQVFYLDLESKDSKPVELITGFDADYQFLGNDGQQFWFQTDQGAPRYRVIAIDLAKPDRKDWKELIPAAEEVLESVSAIGGKLLATYLKDAHSQVKIFSQTGKAEGELKLPGLGTVGGFTGEQDDQETFYTFTGFTTPSTIFRYDVAKNESSVLRRPKVDFAPDDYETKQVFYQSKDGARVPMFIVHKRGLKLDGKNPTHLYGYGGFNISLTPAFSAARIAWFEQGGVLAVPNLRGGGEYGRAWHEAGMKAEKQNVFDDFIAAADWLIENKYTSSPHLAISGRSNGGLLVGACLTQRPELFGAAAPGVGVMDMLRFHKFTIGWAWVNEYGSSDDAELFPVLKAYSPLHNIRPGVKYPPTIIITADHDDRVVPAHSFKFAAALQAAQAGDAPILIRIETSAGHGAGTPTTKQIEEVADTYSFLLHALRGE